MQIFLGKEKPLIINEGWDLGRKANFVHILRTPKVELHKSLIGCAHYLNGVRCKTANLYDNNDQVEFEKCEINEDPLPVPYKTQVQFKIGSSFY